MVKSPSLLKRKHLPAWKRLDLLDRQIDALDKKITAGDRNWEKFHDKGDLKKEEIALQKVTELNHKRQRLDYYKRHIRTEGAKVFEKGILAYGVQK